MEENSSPVEEAVEPFLRRLIDGSWPRSRRSGSGTGRLPAIRNSPEIQREPVLTIKYTTRDHNALSSLSQPLCDLRKFSLRNSQSHLQYGLPSHRSA